MPRTTQICKLCGFQSTDHVKGVIQRGACPEGSLLTPQIRTEVLKKQIREGRQISPCFLKFYSDRVSKETGKWLTLAQWREKKQSQAEEAAGIADEK